MNNLIALKQLRTGELADFIGRYLNEYSVENNYSSGIQTGINFQYFNFSPIFYSKPIISTMIEMPVNGTEIYLNILSGISVSGFYSIWSAPVSQTGYYLNVRASV